MAALPAILADRTDEARFVGYTAAKIPVDPKTSTAASVSDPTTWATFDQAAAWAAAHGGRVGFVALDLLPIDLDGALEDGEPVPWVADLIGRVGCDADVSVGGAGVHLYPEVVLDDELRDLLAGRKVFADGPIERVEFRAGRNGTILGELCWRATRTPAEQTAAVKNLLRELLFDDRVTFRVGVCREAKRRKLHGSLQVLKLLQAADEDGRGYFAEKEAIAVLAGHYARLKHPVKAAQRRLEQFCRSPFGERRRNKDTGGWTVALRDERKVAAAWGIRPGARVLVELAEVAAYTPARLMHLVAAGSRRGGRDLPLPTSRAAKTAIGGASRCTQWRAERQAKAAVLENYLVLGPGDEVPEHRLRQAFETKHGWLLRLPDAVTIPFVRRSRGATRTKGRVQAGFGRRYHRAGEAAGMDHKGRAIEFQGYGFVKGTTVGLWRSVGKK